MATSSANTSPLAELVIRKTQELSEDEIEGIYRVWILHVATEYSVTDFKNKVIAVFEITHLIYDSDTQTIRGFFLGTILRNQLFQGKRMTFVQFGVGFIEEEYRPVCSPVYHQACLDFCMQEALRDPLIPVYAFGRQFTYRAYLATLRLMADGALFPCYNRETPAFEKSLIDDYGRRTQGDLYDPVTGLIKTEKVGVKDGVADIKERHLSNPHIQYFLKRNPDWKKGHMLCLIMKIAPTTISGYTDKTRHESTSSALPQSKL